MFEKIVIPGKNFPTDSALKSFEPCAKYFSKKDPRKYQREIIGIIRHAIEDTDKKYIFLQLPTGGGKSEIAMTIAEYFKYEHNENYYVLSMDHGLTAQYKRDYPQLTEVKGRQNFRCCLPRYSHLMASEAPCTIRAKKFECPVVDDCDYFTQRDQAAYAMGTLSTPYYIDLTTPGMIFDTRFLAIRDECHKLENYYLGIYEIRITDRDWQRIYPRSNLPIHTDPKMWKGDVSSMLEDAKNQVSTCVLDDDIMALEKIIEKLGNLSKLMVRPNNVVIDYEESRKGYKSLLFRPVKASSYSKDIIDGVAQHTLFMSATILSIADRCDHLGLPLDEVLYINFKESFFPKENRHLISLPCGSMSYKRREKTLPKIVEEASKIVDKHGDMRGIIICASHEIRETMLKEMRKKVKNPQYLISHDHGAGSFNKSFDKFLENKSLPYVLITTRYEGLDFHGKLAEFMIYTNLPYSPPQDKQIAARLKMEQEIFVEENSGSCGYEPDDYGMCKRAAWCNNCRRWYDLKVAEAFQQAIGRIIRTPEDVGHLYILDSRFEKFYKQNSEMFLKFIRESIEEVK